MNKRTVYSMIFLLAICLFHVSSVSGQVNMVPQGNGVYDFISSLPKENLHFYEFGDGYCSFEHSPRHEYHSNNVPAQATLYQSGPYDDGGVDDVLAGNPLTGSANPNVPTMDLENKIEVRKSWNLVSGEENFKIIMFENNTSTVQSGCVELHFNDGDISVDQNSILDHYNSWVSNRALLGSDYSYLGYNKKYKWDFNNLSPNEQRFLYIPTVCLRSLMEGVSVMGVIKYTCSSEIPYDPNNDGNQEGVDDSNFFTLTERVRGYPHDPNAIIPIPGALSTYDDYQTMQYECYFQNEGNDFAQDVNVDFFFDEPPFSVSLDSSSHTAWFTNNHISNQQVQISFPAINLPGTGQEPPPNYYQTIGKFTLNVCYDLSVFNKNYVRTDMDIYFDTLDAVSALNYLPRLINFPPYSDCSQINGARQEKEAEVALDTEEIVSKEISIYPNPVEESLHIESLQTTSKTLQFDLYDLNGRIIKSGTIDSKDHFIDVSTFASGIYWLRVMDKQEELLRKTIIKN